VTQASDFLYAFTNASRCPKTALRQYAKIAAKPVPDWLSEFLALLSIVFRALVFD
jgi:hypothetical protein